MLMQLPCSHSNDLFSSNPLGKTGGGLATGLFDRKRSMVEATKA
jgi:hypothetical protein